MRRHMGVVSALLTGAVLVLTGCEPADGGRASGGKAEASTTSVSPSPTASSAATATATANGIERLRPAQILARARAATLAARSLRVHGRVKQDGEKISLDLRFDGRTRATGEVTMNGQRASIIRTGSVVYFKGDDAFWKAVAGKGAVQLLAGKWLKATTKDEGFGELAEIGDRKKLLAEMLKDVGALTKAGGTSRIGGRAALALRGSGGRIYVATEGEPYLLRMDSGADARVDLSGFDEPVTVKAPPKDQVVDLSGLV